MDFYPQYHTTEHAVKHTEFRVEILGSVSMFIDPSYISSLFALVSYNSVR